MQAKFDCSFFLFNPMLRLVKTRRVIRVRPLIDNFTHWNDILSPQARPLKRILGHPLRAIGDRANRSAMQSGQPIRYLNTEARSISITHDFEGRNLIQLEFTAVNSQGGASRVSSDMWLCQNVGEKIDTFDRVPGIAIDNLYPINPQVTHEINIRIGSIFI